MAPFKCPSRQRKTVGNVEQTQTEVGSAVIAGHIDSRTGPGIFFRLSSLRPGDRRGRRADGTLAVFGLTAVRQFPKGQLSHVKI